MALLDENYNLLCSNLTMSLSCDPGFILDVTSGVCYLVLKELLNFDSGKYSTGINQPLVFFIIEISFFHLINSFQHPGVPTIMQMLLLWMITIKHKSYWGFWMKVISFNSMGIVYNLPYFIRITFPGMLSLPENSSGLFYLSAYPGGGNYASANTSFPTILFESEPSFGE